MRTTGPIAKVSIAAVSIASAMTALVALIAGVASASAQQQATPQAGLEMPKLRFAIGGRAGVFYLPVTVTERLGYFKEAGLDVEITDLASGARALQALIGGSADIGTGTFDHTVQMQAKGQPVIAVIQYGRYAGLALTMIASKASAYKTPKDLKGMKIGVTSPGSATHFMAAYMMVRNGLAATDASFIGTGATATAVAAARRGEIDALVTSDPMLSMMLADGLVKIVADGRTEEGTAAIYGGPYPGGIVYAQAAFIEKNPRTVQAVVTAFSRALAWIAKSTPDEIVKLMPTDYSMGNPAIYLAAVAASKPMFSPDGRFVPGGAETAHQVLRVFDTSVAEAKIDLAKTSTSRFVDAALAASK